MPSKGTLPAPSPAPEASPANLAAALLKPSLSAAMVVQEFTKTIGGGADVLALTRALSDSMREVQAGDLKQAEAMLFGQAQALQAIFTNLAVRADAQANAKDWELCLRIALRAQNQCRTTLETLATIKNPTVIFARQANVNNGGHQQVNNGCTPPAPAPKARSAQNKLLEERHGQWLDAGAQSPAGRIDSQLESVGAVDRAAH